MQEEVRFCWRFWLELLPAVASSTASIFYFMLTPKVTELFQYNNCLHCQKQKKKPPAVMETKYFKSFVRLLCSAAKNSKNFVLHRY